MIFAMSPYLILLSVLLLLPLLVVLIMKNPFSTNNKLPPSPAKLPFIGNLHQFLGSLPHRSLHSLSQKHGPLMFLQLGRVPTVVISSADFAREVMKTYDHVFANRPSTKAAKILFNDGKDVAFANGEYWKKVRKLSINNLLSPRLVKSFRQIREEEVSSLMEHISVVSSLSGSAAVDMSGILHSFMNKVTCRAILGDFSKPGMNKLLCELAKEDVFLIEHFCVEDYLPLLRWLDEVTGLGPRTRRLANRWDTFLDEVIAEKEDDASCMPKKEDDGSFFSLLLSLQDDPNDDSKISREDIKILVHQLLLGGTDTSFIVLEWGMAELIRKPEVMKKVKEEIRGIACGKSVIQEEDLIQMRYLKAAIKETMRLHPPLPLLVPRQPTQSCEIQGYEIPKGAKVIINAWSIARDPRFWEEPEEFRPERFLDSPGVDFKGHDFQFVPFGSGRRICPGMQFAILTVELAFANLIHQYDWELPDGMKVEDLNMEELPGVAVCRKVSLCLTPKKVSNT